VSRTLGKPFLAIAVVLAFSCASPPREKPADQKSFLWLIQFSKSRVYILGSIHVARGSIYPLRNSIEEAFRQSDTLAVEVNTTSDAPARLQALLLQHGTYPSGETLREKVSPQIYRVIEDRFNRLGYPVAPFERFRPWLLSVTLENLELQRLGLDAQNGIDRHFLQEGQGTKRILQFETLEDQLQLFDGMTDRDQELFLRYTLFGLDHLASQISALMDAWERGDADALERMVAKDRSEQPELEPMFVELIEKRNRRMFLKIQDFLKTDGNYFVVVGAAHLVGKDGLIDLLRRSGYVVEQR